MSCIPILKAADILPCVTPENGTRIVRSERRAKVTFHNATGVQVEVIEIDECIHRLATTAKADYAFVLPGHVWYVELKGKDAEHGIKQLKNTVLAFKNLHAGKIKRCLLTSTIPKQCGGAAKQQKQFRADCGASLHPVAKHADIVHP